MVNLSLIADESLRSELWGVVKELIAKHIELGQPASGKWVESLDVYVKNGTGIIFGADYTQYLTKGRPPNKNQDPRALSKWAYWMANHNPEFKNWLDIKGNKEYGIQIAFVLGRDGSKSYPKGTGLIDDVITDQRVKKMFDNIGKTLSATIAKELVR